MDRPWLRFYDPHVPRKLEYPDILLPQILEGAAEDFPDRVAVFFFGGKVRYRELRALADQFAHALLGTGLKRGDSLGLLLPNMPQAIVSAFGAWKAGLVVFFFDPLVEEKELERQFHDAGVETLVALDLLLPRVDPIFSKTRLKNFIITGVKDFLPFPRDFLFSLAARGRGLHVKLARKPNVSQFKEFLQRGRPEPLPPGETAADPEEVAVVQYTSGTCGTPKGVMLTHRNLTANFRQVSAWMGNFQRGKEIFSSILPFHQAFGLTLAMNLPISLAAGAIHLPKFENLQFLRAVKSSRPTFFPAWHSMLESLAWNPNLAGYKISSIQSYLSLGQPLPEDALQNFERKAGGKVIEGYGLTEASPLSHANPFSGRRKGGSVGIPLPDTEAKIVDPQDGEVELPAGEAGELLIRGPQVMKGYWNLPEETARTLRQGWLHTGDLARMDEDGFFYILGRLGKK
jgi:long-chain acyl-CoA synthetase